MSYSCPTVRVCNPADPGGYMIINERDFDASVHVLWSETPAEEPVEDRGAYVTFNVSDADMLDRMRAKAHAEAQDGQEAESASSLAEIEERPQAASKPPGRSPESRKAQSEKMKRIWEERRAGSTHAVHEPFEEGGEA